MNHVTTGLTSITNLSTSSVDALAVLYSFRRCPYAMRARLAVAISQQQCTLREIVLRNKPAEMLIASAKATVPVLILANGEVIDQSLEIMLWALQRHDPAHWLSPPRGSMATMQTLISENDGAFKHHLDRYKYPNRYKNEYECEQTFSGCHRDSAAVWLAELEKQLIAHAWLYGNKPSLADMAILPFVRQFAHTNTAWFAAQPLSNLQAWLTRFEASALYQNIMKKYLPWKTGDMAIRFPEVTDEDTTTATKSWA